MATKSILKNIVISDNKSAERLVRALERAEKRKVRPFIFQKKSHDMSAEEMRKIFETKGKI